MTLTGTSDCLNAVTDWNYNARDLMECVEGVFAIQGITNNYYSFMKKRW